MSELEAMIHAEIEASGFVTVARFMEMALYQPGLGYYRRDRTLFGPRGDFYTAENLQPVFGELLASFAGALASQWEAPEKFDVLEVGSGAGHMRAAFSKWTYHGFDWNGDRLPEHFTGLVFANEFFDALPVHVLRKTRKGWNEIVLRSKEGSFVLEDGAGAGPVLAEYARRYGAAIPDGGLLEINLVMRAWVRRLAEALQCGWVLLIDYGYGASELARFPEGTLMSYRKHQADERWMATPGARDITAHVNFTDLREQAVNNGLEVIEESSLGSWALRVWGEEELARKWEEADQRWRLQWKQLLFGLGETFRVLLLKKGCAK